MQNNAHTAFVLNHVAPNYLIFYRFYNHWIHKILSELQPSWDSRFYLILMYFKQTAYLIFKIR